MKCKRDRQFREAFCGHLRVSANWPCLECDQLEITPEEMAKLRSEEDARIAKSISQEEKAETT
jgi:hypothetical protein